MDAQTTVTRTFSNDTTTWLIGLPLTEEVCSVDTIPLQQCRTTTRSFDAYGQLRDETIGTDPPSPETALTTQLWRDAFGNVTAAAATDGAGDVRSSCTTYEPEGIFPWARANALGQVSHATFAPGLGVPLAAADPNGLATSWSYDGLGRAQQETRPDGTSTTYTLLRTEANGVYTVTLETSTTGGGDETVALDERGRPVQRLWYGPDIATKKCAQCPIVHPPRLMQRIVYDTLGEHVVRRSLPAPEGTAEAQLLDDVFAYDATGRIVQQTTPWNLVTAYDYAGTTSTITIGSAPPTIVEHDTLGRTTRVTDAAGGTTSYTYGPFSATWEVQAPDHTLTETTHDAYGRVTQRDDPDSGTTVMHYDGFGELTSSTDALGRQVSFSYDALGRMTTRADQDPTGANATTTWTWDTAPLGTGGKPALGRLAQVTSPGGEKSYTYDGIARPLSTTLAIAGEPASAAMTATLGYDALGRVGTITYPPAAPSAVPFEVQHRYDPYGHLLEVDDAGSGAMYWQFSQVDAEGRIAVETFGNGVQTTRGYYDDTQRLASLQTSGPAGTVQDLAYDYDTRLNLASRTDALQAKTEHFFYDPLDRLVCSSLRTLPVPKGTDYCEHTWSYDAGGNMTAKDGVAYHYDDPAHPHGVTSTGSHAYAYDAVGDQTMRDGATVTYTPFDLPSAFTASQGGMSVTFGYDGDQERIQKSVAGGAVTDYLGDLYERVTNADGSVEHRYYVHGVERMVAIVTEKEEGAPYPVLLESTLYAHVDDLGSVETLTDENGAVQEKRSYDPFGARRNPAWGGPPLASYPSETTRGFTGHEEDAELGLVNMKGRLYDPELARFLTPDPVVSRPFFGQSWNPYSYVLNNPLAYVDPSGFDGWVIAPGGEIIFNPDPLLAPRPMGPPSPPSAPPAPGGPPEPEGPLGPIGPIGPPPPPPPPPPPVGPPQSPQGGDDGRNDGARQPSNDVGIIGNASPPVPQPTPTSPALAANIYGLTLLVDATRALPGRTLNQLTFGLYGASRLGASIGTALVTGGVGAGASAAARGVPVVGQALQLRSIYWAHDWELATPEMKAEAWAHATPVILELGVAVYALADAAGEVGADDAAEADAAEADPAAEEEAEFGPNTVGAAERPAASSVRFTREMHARSEVIARGSGIRKIDELVNKFGGTRSGWTKKKTWDSSGGELHYYEHQGIGRVGVKWAGEPDPF